MKFVNMLFQTRKRFKLIKTALINLIGPLFLIFGWWNGGRLWFIAVLVFS
jgi:hypothetical protein